MPAEDEFDAEIKRVDQQIALLRRRRELSRLQQEGSISDPEFATMRSFQESLQETIANEINRMKLEPPADPTIEEFCRDWVTANWADRFQHLELDHSALPHDIVHEVLRRIYQINSENVELRGETVELYNSYQGALRRRLVPWWERVGGVRTAADKKFSKGAGKRASELRSERRQHEIQRWFSSLSVAFTFATAVFMVLMLVIGGLQLYNAVAEGVGIPWEIAACHESAPVNGDSNELPAEFEDHDCHLIRRNSIANPHRAMQTSLLALEIILVAPLPYLLVLGLTRYIKALAYQERATEFRRELLEFKAFEVALFIAIIAAAIVERTLRVGLKYEYAVSSAIVLAVLSVYYYLIENASKEIEVEDKKTSGELS